MTYGHQMEEYEVTPSRVAALAAKKKPCPIALAAAAFGEREAA